MEKLNKKFIKLESTLFTELCDIKMNYRVITQPAQCKKIEITDMILV